MSLDPWFSQAAHQIPPLVALTHQLAQTLLTLPMICSENSLWAMIAGTFSHPPLLRRPTQGRFSLEDCRQTLMKVILLLLDPPLILLFKCRVASSTIHLILSYVWYSLAHALSIHIHVIIHDMDSLLIIFDLSFRWHSFTFSAVWLSDCGLASQEPQQRLHPS